jgi:hypothetical protein
LVIEPAKYFPLRETWLQDLGHDPSRLVAFNLSDAALRALKNRPREYQPARLAERKIAVVTRRREPDEWSTVICLRRERECA